MPHFNEVDECAGVDALLTNRVWTDLGIDPSTTLHDVRWGAPVQESGVDAFVWVFEISGAAPASHFIDGYAGARGERQPPMYFPRGGSTLKGISKPGEIVFSRIYVEGPRAPHGHRARRRRAALGGGDRAALGGDDAAVADHARRPLRRSRATR